MTTSRPRRHNFNLLARLLHWAMAAGILAMLFVGVGMMSSLSLRPALLNLHQTLGLALLALVVVRLINRLVSGSPPLPADLPVWQVWIAKLSHLALYGLMIVMPLLGWAMRSAGGWPIRLSDSLHLPPIAPVSPVLYAVLRDAHGLLAWAFFGLVIAHLCAALHHGLIRQDGVLASMTTGRKPEGA